MWLLAPASPVGRSSCGISWPNLRSHMRASTQPSKSFKWTGPDVILDVKGNGTLARPVLSIASFSQSFPAMLMRLVGTADTAGDWEKSGCYHIFAQAWDLIMSLARTVADDLARSAGPQI